jgi:hypothetical protein
MVMVIKLSYRPKFLQCYREAGVDDGKDAGQKLTDVPCRSAAGPWNSSQAVAMIHARPTHRHPTDIMGTRVFGVPPIILCIPRIDGL